MIRAVSLLFVGALLLCGWIVMRGQNAPETAQVSQETAAPLDLAELTPATAPEPPVADETVPPQEAEAPKPSALRQRLAAQGRTTLEVPENRVSPAAGTLERPTDPAAIQAAVMAALAPLKQPSPEATADVSSDQLPEGAAQTALAGILAARGLNGNAAPNQGDAASQIGLLVSQALQSGQSDEYVTALLSAAHKEGLYETHDALVKEDGSLDAATLLTQIVSQATQTNPTPQAVGGEGVEVRTVQRAGETQEYRFYTVQPGDSLGYIAQKFYGDAALYLRIWEANRSTLSSPDNIRKGQRLSIPSLED